MSASFLCSINTGTLNAQEISDDNVTSVGQRAGAGNERRKFKAGSFDIIPTISGSVSSDDNVYSDASNEQSDVITKISPKISAVSDWNNHSMGVVAALDVGKYADNSSEDYQDFNFGANGKLDIQRGIALSGNADYRNTHELRSSPDDANGFEPTEYGIFSLGAKLNHDKGLIDFEIAQTFNSYEYDNNRNISGIIDNSIRDRNVYSTSVKAAYEVIPNYKAFIRGIYDVYSYDSTGAVNRDSNGIKIRVGTDINISGKTKGNIYIGWVNREYDNVGFDDVSSVEFGSDLLWNVTGKTSIIADISRDIVETVDVRSSGYIHTRFNLNGEHELQEKILFRSNIGYEIQDFDDSLLFNREDEIYRVGLGVDYYLQRNLKIGLDYSYTEKDSNQSANDYSTNKAGVSAKFNF